MQERGSISLILTIADQLQINIKALLAGVGVMGLALSFAAKDTIGNPAQQFAFFWEYTEKCKKALDEAGIEIPFPHLQLFVEDTDGIKLLASSPKALPVNPES